MASAFNSWHHIVPTSRGGKNAPENTIKLRPQVHRAWHTLFGNLLPEEIITLIRHRWVTKDGKIDKRFLKGEKRQKAWKTIFRNKDVGPEEAINIIKKRFTINGLRR